MAEEVVRAELIETHLDLLRQRHKENQDWWRALDAKAQGSIVGCGILLAGTFASMTAILSAAGPVSRLLLLLVLVFLLGSVALSVVALLVRRTKTPPSAADMTRGLRDVLATIDEEPDRAAIVRSQYLLDQVEPIEICVIDDTTVAVRKASFVFLSQWLLLLGTAALSTLMLLRILGAHDLSENRDSPLRQLRNCEAHCPSICEGTFKHSRSTSTVTQADTTGSSTPTACPSSLAGAATSVGHSGSTEVGGMHSDADR